MFSSLYNTVTGISTPMFLASTWGFLIGVAVLMTIWKVQNDDLEVRFVASRRAIRRRLHGLEKRSAFFADGFGGVEAYMTDMLHALLPLLNERIEGLRATERHAAAVVTVHEARAAYLESVKTASSGSPIQPEAAGLSPQIAQALEAVDVDTRSRIIDQHIALCVGARDHFKGTRDAVKSQLEHYEAVRRALMEPVQPAEPAVLSPTKPSPPSSPVETHVKVE